MKIIKKSKKSALILWYTIDLNYGDYLIFQTVKGYLKDWGFEVEGIDVGLPYREIAKIARKYDILWFAGGGIIERGIPDIIINFKKFHKKARKIKYGVTGLSIGNFNYSNEIKAIQYWVANASFFLFTRFVYSKRTQ